jgi:DNA invertase Pin-like site-specific DNA recombinase
MRVAIYARFSSDLQDARSITDQLALAREHAARQGWLVVAEFTDAAISGASMANRPGLQDLMRAAQARLLDAVLTESLDRLSRDLADCAALHRQLAYWGVRIVTLADGDVNKMLVAVKGLLGSMFLDDLAQKTKRGQVGRVKVGRNPGGRCYGGYRMGAVVPGAIRRQEAGAPEHHRACACQNSLQVHITSENKSPQAPDSKGRRDTPPATEGHCGGPLTGVANGFDP